MTENELFSLLNEIIHHTLFRIKDTPVTILSVLIFFMFITGFILLGVICRNALNRSILRRFKVGEGTSYTLSRITQYSIILVGALISFQFIGVDLSGLAVIFGLLSVGIGFGLQNVTANFISGLIILFERPITIGDRVMVGNIEGDVMEINIRATKVRTVNNIIIIVPNTEFISKDVINYSHGDPTYRVDIEVGVAYGSDLDTVLNSLEEVAKESKLIRKSPGPEVYMDGFGDSSWNMQLRVWISDVKLHPRVRNELNQAIVRKFRANNIEIPFPQRDLHLRSSVEVPVRTEDEAE